MPNVPDAVIQQLCERLQVNSDFLVQCIQESVIEIHEIDGHWELSNGTVLRLRQVERICSTLNIGLSGALVLLKLTQKVAELEEEVQLLRRHL